MFFLCALFFFFLTSFFFFFFFFFFFQAEDGIRDLTVTGVQTCALPIFATAILTLNFYSLTTRPALGAEYARSSGKVLHVTADGPARETGLRVGDRKSVV